MKNELLDKDIILPSGEIGKNKINLVAGGKLFKIIKMLYVRGRIHRPL